MDERDWLAKRFEDNRSNLRKVARRMLGSSSEADDAVQEAWIRLSRADTREVENLGGWLTTVVARVCLDALRARKTRDARTPETVRDQDTSGDPERDVLVADSIGSALLIVLDALEPAERVAFVLHDMFDMPFEEIAPIVGRSPIAARQLASRARRRVQGGAAPEVELRRQGEVVNAFLAASRDGNFEALLAVLDPNVVLRADAQAVKTADANGWPSLASEVSGAQSAATTLRGRARGLRPALIDGSPGAVWAHGGQTLAVWMFVIDDGRVVELELVMDPARLAQLAIEDL
jgi:RNA polymerase sigma factor (sigma-70 family)